MSATTAPPLQDSKPRTKERGPGGGVLNRRRGKVATVVMIVLAFVWLFPLLWSLYNSFRDYSYTQTNGYLSFGGWTTDNYREAWSRGQFGLHLKNSLLITIPAVALTLFLSSLVGFVLSRFSYRFNLTLLGVFLAANLLPPQALLIPVFRMFREIPLPSFMFDTGLCAIETSRSRTSSMSPGVSQSPCAKQTRGPRKPIASMCSTSVRP